MDQFSIAMPEGVFQQIAQGYGSEILVAANWMCLAANKNLNSQTRQYLARQISLLFRISFIKSCQKTSPFVERMNGYLVWNLKNLTSIPTLLISTSAAGHAVSACGEIVRPGGIDCWFAAVKFPTGE